MKINSRTCIWLFAGLLLAGAGFEIAYNRWLGIRSRAYSQMAYRFSANDDWERAIQYYTKSIQLSPQNPTAFNNRGDAYFRLKRFDEAIHDFTEAIRLAPTNSMVLDYRGLAYGMKGDLTNAIIDFGRAIRLQPKDAHLHFRRGYAYALKRNWDSAQSNYMRAIQLDSTNPIFYQGLAYTYFQQRDPSDAVRNYDKAIQLDSNDPSYLNSFAWFLAVYPEASVRDGQKAVKLAEKACELSHWEKWYCIGTLAAAYAEMGDYTNAVKFQKRSMRLDGATESEISEEQQRLELYLQQHPYHEAMELGHKADKSVFYERK